MSEGSDSRVLVLVGSLRAASINRQLAELATETSPAGVTLELFDLLGELPFYNEDIDRAPEDGGVPEPVAALREAAARADAALVVTPEYNGSIPGVLKNAIDWLSRPFGAGAFGGKPVAVVGTAYGQFGGVWAQDETRKSVGIAGGKVLEEVKLSIPGSLVRFAETHPADDAEVAAQLAEVVAQLHSNAGEVAAA